MLEKQLREVRELREQIEQSPVVLESPFKAKGLQIVSMPEKGDNSSREFRKREKRRAQKAQYKLQTTLASKLQGFKVAA